MFSMKFSVKPQINVKNQPQITMKKREVLSSRPSNITHLMMERPKRCGSCNGAK